MLRCLLRLALPAVLAGRGGCSAETGPGENLHEEAVRVPIGVLVRIALRVLHEDALQVANCEDVFEVRKSLAVSLKGYQVAIAVKAAEFLCIRSLHDYA